VTTNQDTDAMTVEATADAAAEAPAPTPDETPAPTPVAASERGPDRAADRMPAEFDPERRGQDAPRPPGGRDPEPDRTAQKERRVLWLLMLMIALLIGIPTLVGIFGLIVVALGGTT
jgi:hypothetical protein